MGARPLLERVYVGMGMKLLPTSDFARFCTEIEKWAEIEPTEPQQPF